MRTIWKYVLDVTDEQDIEVPQGSKLLSVQVQKGEVCLWVLVTNKTDTSCAKIIIHGTGHPIHYKTELEFLGTFQLDGGNFIGHCFGIVN